ncbi:DNA polymerase I [Natronogracilivirga saccharolytica]|nr:DNA polymerase I [Natronogracilivirga saccharolytica]
MPEKLFLIDGTALAYRSYFAMIKSNLKNAEGIPTGAMYGFANALVNLLDKEKPEFLAVAWDTHAPTFRHEMDENYKANRPPQPEELQKAIPLIKEMVALFGFENIEKDGYEADDLIGTLATEAKNEQVAVYMVTPDKDFMQLVGDNVYMYKPLNRGDGFDIIDSQGVVDYFGVSPEQVVDILALIGDTSDNIPGVPGIGKKGAAKIIGEYETLENAIDQAPSMKSKRAREGLTNNKDQALKSREMIIINTDVPETVSWKELKWHGVDTEKLVSFFKRMQFRSLARKIATADSGMLGTISDKLQTEGQGSLFDVEPEPGTESESVNSASTFDTLNPDEVDYITVTSSEALQSSIDTLMQAGSWSFDTETTSTNPQQADLLGIAFSDKKNRGWYVHVSDFDKKTLLQMLKPLFERNDVLKVAHHFKYDYRVLQRFGITIKGKCFDTMLAAYLIDSGQKMDMNSLAQGYLNYDPVSIESLIGEKGRNQKSMRDIPLEDVAPYACEDADITLQLFNVMKKKLQELEVTGLAENIEFPLARVLGDMESNGFKLDLDLLSSFSDELERDIISLRDKIYHLTGEEFNINSTQQLGNILFEKMNLPSKKKTATGKYSTSEQVLAQLAQEYDVAAKILEYRGLSKLKSTYVDALPKLVNETTGRIHSTFNQHVTATGRLSSTQPNLQNIPVRTERGRGIRKAFVAAEGYRILAVDYSQIELRIIASISGDEAMIRAFNEDEDIHSRTAAELFGADSLEKVDREQRRKAKEVNFGIPYGVSAFGLAQRLGISNKEGRAIIDAYFDRFPGIRSFIEETTAFAREKGYVQTLSGRRRYIPDIHSRNQNIRGFAERTAVNMPIQGTAADLIKIAMIEVDKALASDESRTRMLLQVHDELVFELPEEETETTPQKIRSIMEQAMDLKVPLKAETGISDNWLDAH